MGDSLKPILLSFLFLLIAFRGNGQPVIAPPGEPALNQVFVSIGLEPEIVTTVGYLHFIGSRGKNLNFYAGGSIKLAPLLISSGAWRANAITAVDYNISDNWGGRFTTSLYNAHDRNRAGIMDGLGFELRATPVHYGKNWITGFDVGWQYTALTHIDHSAAARRAFEERYPQNRKGIEGPRDGWYRAAVSRFRVGLVGSRKLDDHWRLQFQLGSLLFVQRQGILLAFSHAQVPIYLNTQVEYGW